MTKAFICHSAADKPLATEICRCLESEGVGCWIAPRDVPVGSQWAEAITNAIDACSVFLLIFTANSNGSNQVVREVERAVRREKVIVNYKADNIPCSNALDYYLAVHQWFEPSADSVAANIKDLAAHLGQAGPPEWRKRTPNAETEAPKTAFPAHAPASPPPHPQAAITFQCLPPWIATLPLMKQLLEALALIPYLAEKVLLIVDGVVAAEGVTIREVSLRQTLPLGDHSFQIRLGVRGAHTYPLRLDQPGDYLITVRRSWFTSNFMNQYEISRDGSAPLTIRAAARSFLSAASSGG